MQIKFKDNFSFGCAISGPQTEGSFEMSKSVWDLHFENDMNEFWDNVGPNITSDTYHRYKEDCEIASEIGLNSVRTSIQWSRIFNNPFTLEVNQKGVDFYLNYFQEIKSKGIDLFVGLSHFDIPASIYEKYEGFLSRETVELFKKYAKFCFDTFGHLVDRFVTFNEPYSYVSGMYIRSAMLPEQYNFKKFFTTYYHILICHSEVVNIFRKGKYTGDIGIVLDCMVPYARDELNAGDKQASDYADLIKNRSYLDPCVKGYISEEFLELVELTENKLPILPGDEVIIKNGVVKFVGINYYRPERVKSVEFLKNPSIPWGPEHLYQEFKMPKSRQNKHRGWEIYPKALYDLALRMRDDYPEVSWYVSENGMGVEGESAFLDDDGQINDDYRIEYISEHLYWLNKAIEEGSNCFGYHVWTFIDNWSWRNAYKNRYGFVSLDLKTRDRSLKKSAYWYKDVAKTKEVNVDFLFEVE